MCIKVAVVTFLTLQALKSRHEKHGKRVDLVQLLLVANVSIMYAVILFDLTVQYIFAFFLLVYSANYLNFLAYNVLVRNVKTAEGPLLRSKTNTFFVLMNVIYIANFGFAFFEWYGPWCTPNNIYPPCLTIAACLYWCNYFFHRFYLQKNKYFLKWEQFDVPQ